VLRFDRFDYPAYAKHLPIIRSIYFTLGLMIDRASRDVLAARLRALVAGNITNDAYERDLPIQSADPAIAEIIWEAWNLYDDFSTHRLRGPWRVKPQDRTVVARCILFLKSDVPYEWPVSNRSFPVNLLRLAIHALSLGLVARHRRRNFAAHPSAGIWPFMKLADYESSRAKPVFLAA
jgi:hypothetical protein